jgi:hypothetical protein
MGASRSAFGDHKVIATIYFVQIWAFDNNFALEQLSDGADHAPLGGAVLLKHDSAETEVLFAMIPLDV